MNVIERINELMKKEHLSDYKLAKLAELPNSTISNMRKRNTVPSIHTLTDICGALNISLSQFFAGEDTQSYPVTPKQKEFLDYYILLSDEQQDLIFEIVKNMKREH